MINESDVSFHEASVVMLSADDRDVLLTAEDVWVRGELKKVRVVFSGYEKTEDFDGVELNADPHSLMLADDGEILTLKCLGNKVTLVVEWNDFANSKRETSSYKFKVTSFNAEILDP